MATRTAERVNRQCDMGIGSRRRYEHLLCGQPHPQGEYTNLPNPLYAWLTRRRLILPL